MAGSRKWAQGMGHDPVLAEEDAPVTQLQFRYVGKGGGRGRSAVIIIALPHTSNASTTSSQSPSGLGSWAMLRVEAGEQTW